MAVFEDIPALLRRMVSFKMAEGAQICGKKSE